MSLDDLVDQCEQSCIMESLQFAIPLSLIMFPHLRSMPYSCENRHSRDYLLPRVNSSFTFEINLTQWSPKVREANYIKSLSYPENTSIFSLRLSGI